MADDDWQDQQRPPSRVSGVGEAALGGLIAVTLQAGLSGALIGGASVLTGAGKASNVPGWLSCVACGQFVWLLPVFVVALWWRPGFAGGLAAGAMFGAALGVGLACLVAAT